MCEWRELGIIQSLTEPGIGGAVNPCKISSRFQCSAECNRSFRSACLGRRSSGFQINKDRIFELLSLELCKEAFCICLSVCCGSAARPDKIIRSDSDAVSLRISVVFFPSGICVESVIRSARLDNGELNTGCFDSCPVNGSLPVADINLTEGAAEI